MPWLQLTLTTDKTQAATVEALFERLGALSVTYDDAGKSPLHREEWVLLHGRRREGC